MKKRKDERRRKEYRGMNLNELEANIEHDKQNNDWIIVSEAILSNNPEWLVQLIYREK